MTFRYSASQIKTAQLCLKKWAYQKIDQVPEERGGGANEGTILHKELELWLLTGKKPPQGSVSWNVIPYLPLPKEDFLVEYPFEIITPYGKASGFVDLVIPNTRDVTMPAHLSYIPDDSVVVIDHKSCKNLRYVPTPEQLAKDPQVILYGLAIRTALKLPEGSDVYFAFHYFTKVAPFVVKPVLVKQTSEMLIKGMEDFRPLLTEMKILFDSRTKAAMVDGDQDGCRAFGGCYLRKTCPDSDKNKKVSLVSIGKVSSNKKVEPVSTKALEMAKRLMEKTAAKQQEAQAEQDPEVTPIEQAAKVIQNPFSSNTTVPSKASVLSQVFSQCEDFVSSLEGAKFGEITIANNKVVLTILF